MDYSEILKWLTGGMGLSTLIGWLYKEIASLKTRMMEMEKQVSLRPTAQDTRQLIDDLQAPIKTDIEYIKSKSRETNDKLDKILEKLLKNG